MLKFGPVSKSKTSSTKKSASENAKDYYALLGVNKSADDDAIKKAYRQMAMKYHPDRNAGNAQSEETFKNVKTAYETLSNPELRAKYDRFGAEGVQGTSNGFGDFSGVSEKDLMAEMFRQFVDGRFQSNSGYRYGARTPPPPAPGKDVVVYVTLTLEEAFTGKTMDVSIPLENDSTNAMETIQVDIPAGIDSNMRVRVAGRGRSSANPQGAKGALYVHVHVAAHERYQRVELDLHTSVDILWTTAWRSADDYAARWKRVGSQHS